MVVIDYPYLRSLLSFIRLDMEAECQLLSIINHQLAIIAPHVDHSTVALH